MVEWNTTNTSNCIELMFSVNPNSCYVLLSYFVTISLGINLVLGVPANCYILWLSVKEMIQGQSTEIFVFNAALVEVIFCSCYVFLIEQYFFNCTYCKFGTYFTTLVMLVGRPLFQSCICVERYIGVLHPVIFLKFKPMKYRIAISVIGWILIISSSVIVSVNIIELQSLVLPELLVFLSIKVFSCLMVLKALKRPGPSDENKRKDGVNQDKLKAFRIIRIVLVSAVLMYGPMIISLVFYYIMDLKNFLLSWTGALGFGLMLGFVQPFLYLRRVGKTAILLEAISIYSRDGRFDHISQ